MYFTTAFDQEIYINVRYVNSDLCGTYYMQFFCRSLASKSKNHVFYKHYIHIKNLNEH